MARLAHFSDIHVTAAPLGWQRKDWFNKRLPGWINYRWLGRRHRFQCADLVLTQLIREIQSRSIDHIVFSGDATAMGFTAEFARAAELMNLDDPSMSHGLAVPGNHDYYTIPSAAGGDFERFFTRWQKGIRVDSATYPFAQKVGNAWLVGVNSATANRWMWDASGRVDEPQLARLAKLLRQLNSDPFPKILVTHYPVCLKNGKMERKTHGLRNVNDLIDVAASGGVSLWLHGHRHNSYHLERGSAAPFPIVCVGSATQSGIWGYNEYEVDAGRITVTRRVYDSLRRIFFDFETFSLPLLQPRSCSV